eukprot:CAMPEP_0178441826 /NCGR_PEP_ID=MMETSP0689_2-20121128/37743_1 /TAXON_ID=160604 /ORGANISM="Amphidinium massartii, Strain CS-259" /LENGTH=602 /DNA_ID=CAMNT_0020065141 /DNA_START=96 /DNA_END=1904 /DNA_ORIENTATION=+
MASGSTCRRSSPAAGAGGLRRVKLLLLLTSCAAWRPAMAARPKNAYALEAAEAPSDVAAASAAEMHARSLVMEGVQDPRERWGHCMKVVEKLMKTTMPLPNPVRPEAWEEQMTNLDELRPLFPGEFEHDTVLEDDEYVLTPILDALEARTLAAGQMQQMLAKIAEQSSKTDGDFGAKLEASGPIAQRIINELIMPFSTPAEDRFGLAGGMIHPAVILTARLEELAQKLEDDHPGAFQSYRGLHPDEFGPDSDPPIFTGSETPRSLFAGILTLLQLQVPWGDLENLAVFCSPEEDDYITVDIESLGRTHDEELIQAMAPFPIYRRHNVYAKFAKGFLEGKPLSPAAADNPDLTADLQWKRCLDRAKKLMRKTDANWAMPNVWEEHLQKFTPFKDDRTLKPIIFALETLVRAAGEIQGLLQSIAGLELEDIDPGPRLLEAGPKAVQILNEYIRPFKFPGVGRMAAEGAMLNPSVIIGNTARDAASLLSMKDKYKAKFKAYRDLHSELTFTDSPVFGGTETPLTLVNDLLASLQNVPWVDLENLIYFCSPAGAPEVTFGVGDDDSPVLAQMKRLQVYRSYNIYFRLAQGFLASIPSAVAQNWPSW